MNKAEINRQVEQQYLIPIRKECMDHYLHLQHKIYAELVTAKYLKKTADNSVDEAVLNKAILDNVDNYEGRDFSYRHGLKKLNEYDIEIITAGVSLDDIINLVKTVSKKYETNKDYGTFVRRLTQLAAQEQMLTILDEDDDNLEKLNKFKKYFFQHGGKTTLAESSGFSINIFANPAKDKHLRNISKKLAQLDREYPSIDSKYITPLKISIQQQIQHTENKIIDELISLGALNADGNDVHSDNWKTRNKNLIDMGLNDYINTNTTLQRRAKQLQMLNELHNILKQGTSDVIRMRRIHLYIDNPDHASALGTEGSRVNSIWSEKSKFIANLKASTEEFSLEYPATVIEQNVVARKDNTTDFAKYINDLYIVCAEQLQRLREKLENDMDLFAEIDKPGESVTQKFTTEVSNYLLSNPAASNSNTITRHLNQLSTVEKLMNHLKPESTIRLSEQNLINRLEAFKDYFNTPAVQKDLTGEGSTFTQLYSSFLASPTKKNIFVGAVNSIIHDYESHHVVARKLTR